MMFGTVSAKQIINFSIFYRNFVDDTLKLYYYRFSVMENIKIHMVCIDCKNNSIPFMVYVVVNLLLTIIIF